MDKEYIDNGIYIEPISACNLKCRLCYTNVVNNPRQILAKDEIVDFVDRYIKFKKERFSIYWCGSGELFLHEDFPQIINESNHLSSLYNIDVKHFINTNGTIDRLDEFDTLRNISFRVSIDGLKKEHEWNRGLYTYDKIINFAHHAVKQGCESMEARVLLRLDNIQSLNDLKEELQAHVDNNIMVGFTIPYTTKMVGNVESNFMKKDINFEGKEVSLDQIKQMFKLYYPEKYAGVFRRNSDVDTYVALTYRGVYSCCEGIYRIGDIETPMDILVNRAIWAKDMCRNCSLYDNCLNDNDVMFI
jgi:MoaA/NifB/PqqE/SkfB family radical SAM enzyme